MKPRILIECTYVFDHPDDNTGIQRVVRNIVQRLASVRVGAEAVPVIVREGRLWKVNRLRPDTQSIDRTKRIRDALRSVRDRFWGLHGRIERRPLFNRHYNARRVLHWSCKLLILPISAPLWALQGFRAQDQAYKRRVEDLISREGDIFLLLDSSWHAEVFEVADRLGSEGVDVVSVIYDLIPLTHPQFCDPPLVDAFERWFEWIVTTASGFICISDTVSQTVKRKLAEKVTKPAMYAPWHDYFHLGSELDLVARGAIDPGVRAAFAGKAPTYLIVSTIEPRKNHSYLIDAFEEIWKVGSSARLCIIGRVGWKCEALIERINRHPEFGSRLFMFNKVDDRNLEYAYTRARALIMPSFIEGFGLPIVEAMQRGVRAIASDIPVFREVGGEYVAYVDPYDHSTLADMVLALEASGEFPAARTIEDWKWLTWEDSCEQLLSRTLSNVLRERARRPERVRTCSSSGQVADADPS
jgi:O-antigen biosynthesis alpha-1,2-rhamnosyltransferase